MPYDPNSWLPVPDPAALPSIEDITLDAHVTPSPGRAEPHDPDAWLPLPDDVDALPTVDELLAPPPDAQRDAMADADAVTRAVTAAAEAASVPSPARARPHDPGAWLPVPNPDHLVELPELVAGDASVPRGPERQVRTGWAPGLRALLAVLVVVATAVVGVRVVEDRAATPPPAHAFTVNVDFDGSPKEVRTTARTATGLMHELHVGKFVTVRNIPGRLHAGSDVVLRTRHNGTLLVDGQEVAFDSPSRTVGELLTAYRVVLAGDDYTSPSVDSVLNDGDQVTVYRVGGETKQRTEPIPFTDEHVPDPNTPIGQTSELRPGQNGLMTITYRERIENGVIVGDSVLSEVPTIPAVSHLIGDGTQADWHWDALANCESGGRWNTVDPATPAYDGGIGIYRGTWIAFGGRQFAPNAGLATREQQIIIGQRIEAQYGWTAWGCGRYMGW